MMVKRTLLAIGVSAALVLTACGGGDDDDSDGDRTAPAQPIATPAPPETPPPTEPSVVEVPADWFEAVPVPEIEGMRLVAADVRGEGAEARYDLRYDGDPLDAQVVYDEYAVLLTEAGWLLVDSSTALVGTYELDGNTLTLVVTSDSEQSRLTVAVTPSA